MEGLEEVFNTEFCKAFEVKKEMLGYTIKDLLEELNIENEYYGAYANGEKVKEDYALKEKDNIMILGHIVGG